jgi:Arc/MetJ-type ribon-helix-helix transcriptional regulator
MPTEHYRHLSIRITPALDQQLETLMTQQPQYKSKNELVRACIRAYLDETGDFLGSRRHFSKQMGERLDQIEASLLWQMLLTQMLIAQGHLTILDELVPADAAAEPPTPAEQLSRATQHSQRFLAHYLSEQEGLITQLSEHLRKKRAVQSAKMKKSPEKA